MTVCNLVGMHAYAQRYMKTLIHFYMCIHTHITLLTHTNAYVLMYVYIKIVCNNAAIHADTYTILQAYMGAHTF